MTHSAEWNRKKIAEQLVGGYITEAVLDKGEDQYDEPYFGMVVAFPDRTKKVVWILSDDEGNACGGLDIVPLKD